MWHVVLDTPGRPGNIPRAGWEVGSGWRGSPRPGLGGDKIAATEWLPGRWFG